MNRPDPKGSDYLKEVHGEVDEENLPPADRRNWSPVRRMAHLIKVMTWHELDMALSDPEIRHRILLAMDRQTIVSMDPVRRFKWRDTKKWRRWDEQMPGVWFKSVEEYRPWKIGMQGVRGQLSRAPSDYDVGEIVIVGPITGKNVKIKESRKWRERQPYALTEKVEDESHTIKVWRGDEQMVDLAGFKLLCRGSSLKEVMSYAVEHCGIPVIEEEGEGER